MMTIMIIGDMIKPVCVKFDTHRLGLLSGLMAGRGLENHFDGLGSGYNHIESAGEGDGTGCA